MLSRSWHPTAVLLVALAAGCAPAVTRPAPFRVRPDSTAAGDLRGPFEGRVLDAQTGRPVAGALVYATWSFVEGYGLLAPAGTREFVGSTDAAGVYRIPRLGDMPSGKRRLSDFRLVIYKRGYVAYRSDRRYPDFTLRTEFTQKGNEVALRRWRSDLSHVQHLRYVGGGPVLAAVTTWEVAEAVAELSPREDMQVAGGERPPLDAKTFLTLDDVQHLTGYEGEMEVRALGDAPEDDTYSTVHIRAKDKTEDYDIALRVWALDPAAAQRTYGQLLVELPNVVERNEIGDRSLRATSGTKDIYGVGYLDGRRGIVALLTCGVSQCKKPEDAVDLVRLVKSRIEQWWRQGQ